jgi:uncharacterized protein DUF1559
MCVGDADDRVIDPKGEWYRVSATINTGNSAPGINLTPMFNACSAVTPMTGAGNQASIGGQNWTNGNYVTSRYNHVMTPNTKSCAVDVSAANPINFNGNATTASSRHPGGVLVGLCDGSTRFVQNAVSISVWRALGGRNDGVTFTLP